MAQNISPRRDAYFIEVIFVKDINLTSPTLLFHFVGLSFIFLRPAALEELNKVNIAYTLTDKLVSPQRRDYTELKISFLLISPCVFEKYHKKCLKVFTSRQNVLQNVKR